jgi:hypothetical protein
LEEEEEDDDDDEHDDVSIGKKPWEKACWACKLEHALPTLVTGEKRLCLYQFWGPFLPRQRIYCVFRLFIVA